MGDGITPEGYVSRVVDDEMRRALKGLFAYEVGVGAAGIRG